MGEKDTDRGRESATAFRLDQAHYVLLALLITCLFFCYHMLEPYLNAVILAILLAVVFNPVHKRIEQRVKGRKTLAAVCSSILLVLVVVVPLLFMFGALVQQGVASFNAICEWIEAGKYEELQNTALFARVIEFGEQYLPSMRSVFPAFDPERVDLGKIFLTVSSSLGRSLLNQSEQLAGNITSFIVRFFLMIFTFFFIVRDQRSLSRSTLRLVPMSSVNKEKIVTKIKAVSRSALLGTLVTAVAIGIAGGLAFWIAGLPGLFWGTAMAFASLIPVVGGAIIWIPAAVYLFMSGQWGYGIFIVLWFSLVVGLLDNLIRPLFMKGPANMSTLLIFFSIMGGLNYFGLIGLLYGPLIFGLTTVLIYIYSLEFEPLLSEGEETD